MMTCVIIDHNEMDQLVLSKLIQSDSELELKGIYGNAVEAISLIKSVNPDLIFLDVEMPHMSGLEFLNAVKDVPQIIMVTSHSKYAIEAFENDVTDFLVKPPNKERFDKAVLKAKKIAEWLALSSTDDEYIFIRVDGQDIKVLLKDILYIEAMSDYVRIQTIITKYTVLSTMKSISTRLPNDDFIRVHRSYIVNKINISSLKGDEIIIGELTIPVSRSRKKELKLALK